MKYLIVILMLALNGCALTEAHDKYIERLDSVRIGDSYKTMLAKVDDIPHRVKCYQSSGYGTCTAVYMVSQYNSFMFTFDSNDILTSIYY